MRMMNTSAYGSLKRFGEQKYLTKSENLIMSLINLFTPYPNLWFHYFKKRRCKSEKYSVDNKKLSVHHDKVRTQLLVIL
ncbi:hypothetical protein [Jeotgalicoccus sp. ATCC 8456]|uniref:hypothetical protein n=1 Tax=Jeotgalicoccus TaxID=227979 RepID=UPI00351CAC5A